MGGREATRSGDDDDAADRDQEGPLDRHPGGPPDVGRARSALPHAGGLGLCGRRTRGVPADPGGGHERALGPDGLVVRRPRHHLGGDPGGGVRFPEGAGASVEALWQLAPDTAERPGVVWAGTQPSALWRSEDGGETFELVLGLWDHPHRPTWAPGYGGQAVHTVLPDPSNDDRVLVAMSTAASTSRRTAGRPGTRRTPGSMPGSSRSRSSSTASASTRSRATLPTRTCCTRRTTGGIRLPRWWRVLGAGRHRSAADFGFPVVAHPTRGGTPSSCRWLLTATGWPRARSCRSGARMTRCVVAAAAGGPSRGLLRRRAPRRLHRRPGRPFGLYLGGRDGSVYASADEGASWHEVVRHLPDVLCVRASAT